MEIQPHPQLKRYWWNKILKQDRQNLRDNNLWYYFSDKQCGTNFQFIMSQNLRNEAMGDKDISRTATEGAEAESYKGFEGMNYEQIRQPYNPEYKGRNSFLDERNGSKRPDAA